MSVHPVYYLINYIMLVANIALTIFCFGVRRKPNVPIMIAFGGVLVFNLVVYFHPITAKIFEDLPVSIIWFIFLLYFNKGRLFPKLFIYSGALFVTVFLYVLSSFITEYFFPYESRGYMIMLPVLAITLFIVYVWLAWRFGKQICDKLFTFSRTSEWVIYMIVPVASLVMIGYLYETQGVIWHPISVQDNLYFLLLPVFMLACFAFIITAIINTHEKSKQRFDAEYAQSIISSGRDHYQKMENMQEKLRILRHDYKYHLNATRKLLRSGDTAEAVRYLNDVEEQLSLHELPNYCSNTVINALVASYAERCESMEIKFSVNLSALETLKVPNYEMCIIIGNLLENAISACEKLSDGRKIELAVQNTNAQCMLMVKNSFDGNIQHENGEPVSMKHGGGLGLKSVKAVATRYGGDLFMEWDKHTFTAYVTIRL